MVLDTAKRPALRLENGAWRLFFVGSAAAILVVGLVPTLMLAPDFRGYTGIDYATYMEATGRFLRGGSFYWPMQLEGPYLLWPWAVLYPPVAIYLFAPFTFLPPPAWWLGPLAIVAWSWWRLRPAYWAWPLMAFCIVWPSTQTAIIDGNPAMWMVAFLSVGVVYAGPAVLVLMKPTLAPFALWGARRRRWWLWLAAFALACIPFGALWLDYATVLANTRAGLFDVSPLYSLYQVPMMLLPIVAWAASPGALAKVRLKLGWAAPPQSTAQPAEH